MKHFLCRFEGDGKSEESKLSWDLLSLVSQSWWVAGGEFDQDEGSQGKETQKQEEVVFTNCESPKTNQKDLAYFKYYLISGHGQDQESCSSLTSTVY